MTNSQKKIQKEEEKRISNTDQEKIQKEIKRKIYDL